MRNRIAISGTMCSGKTFFADLLSVYGYKRISFSTPLKELEQLHVSYKNKEVDRMFLKNTLKSYAEKLKVDDNCVNEMIDLFDKIDVVLPKNRELLQKLGTDIVRRYNNNAWCDYLISSINENDYYVVDDMRFKNEFDVLKNNGFLLVRIRPNEEKRLRIFQKLYPSSDYNFYSKHPSETDLNSYDEMNIFDIYIYNDYTKESERDFITMIKGW